MDVKIIIMLVIMSVPVHGVILFQENFEDTNFASRGWYDHLSGTVTTSEHVSGSNSAYECVYTQGQTGCSGGEPGRHKFTESDTVYLSYWVKYSTNYIGSGRPYHPHEFHFVTNKDSDYVGPAGTYLTTYTEHVALVPMMGIQDLQNVNNGCIVRNSDSYDACSSYNYGTSYSVASCNGKALDFTNRDCFNSGNGWYSAINWMADDQYFKDETGLYYKNDWHFIEAMWQMNTITGSTANYDGKIRYWYDGEELISSDNVLLRNPDNVDMMFDQFLTGMYIGDGSPVTQTMWVDNLTVSTHRIGYSSSSTICGDGACNGTEDCQTCASDCGNCCGDSSCNPTHGENCSTCITDCGACQSPDCNDDLVCQGAVFCSGFEEGNKDIWDDYDANDDSTNLLMTDPGPCNDPQNTVMRFRALPGRGGADLVKVLPTQHDKLYARWYQKWEQGYDFSANNHGGGLHAGARNNLGRSDYRPQGNDWFSTWLEPGAGTGELAGRHNLYSYYRGMYIDCANPQGQCWGDHFPCMIDDGPYWCEKPEHREHTMTPVLEDDRWYCLEIMLDGGTPVTSDAQADGVQNFWIDGIEYGPFEHLWHRTTPNLKITILWLSMWHHDDHSVEGVMMDNVVVSENRIGCLGAPAPVTCSSVDTNSNGIVSATELNTRINNWRAGTVTITTLFNSIDEWKHGC